MGWRSELGCAGALGLVPQVFRVVFCGLQDPLRERLLARAKRTDLWKSLWN